MLFEVRNVMWNQCEGALIYNIGVIKEHCFQIFKGEFIERDKEQFRPPWWRANYSENILSVNITDISRFFPNPNGE